MGGSSAERIIHCPKSYQLLKLIPDDVKNKSSAAADEGTALHEAMEFILRENIIDLDEIMGMTFGVSESAPEGFVMTRELVEEALQPCVDFFDALCDELEAEGGIEFLIEKRCEVPGIPGGFGTSDIIFRTKKRSGIIDWKFGVGVQVLAAYRNEEGEWEPNSQPMFYARGGMHSYPNMFEDALDWPVHMYIVQPRSRFLQESDPIFSEHVVTVKQLEEFRIKLVKSVSEALHDENARCVAGHWCKFQACKSICPHHTGPMLDLSKLQPKEVARVAEMDRIQYGELLGQYLDVCEMAEAIVNEVRKQAHAYLEAGHSVPGYKLVDKRATERYVDDKGAQRHAIGLGVPEEETLEPATVKSPAQLAAVMEPFMEGTTKKARLTAAREQLKEFTSSTSSGTTLARETDGRPDAIPPSQQVAALSDKLATLLGR